VPGCSSGEEAYSLAICLLEYLGDKAAHTPIQIFATDVSEAAVEKARQGQYLENITADVSPQRLRRFFVKTEGGYQISQTVRDLCVFARQNVVQDPPFSHIDLISCRNVLIYLGSVLQKRILPVFHYALRPGGFLMLGSSETVGAAADLFSLKNKKHKIYAKKVSVGRAPIDFSAGAISADLAALPGQIERHPVSKFDILKEADQIAIERYAPAGVVVGDDMEIVQFRGRTGPYLEPIPGEASLNVLKMIRADLLLELRGAVHKARKTEQVVRAEGLQIKYNGAERQINLEVIPIRDAQTEDRFFLILFEKGTPLPKPSSGRVYSPEPPAKKIPPAKRTRELEKELETTKQYLQTIIEEQESTNEELRSANEEIQSSNEELQSTNEELETAKEELQSTNEELTTMNEELENRNDELSRVNSDLSNLLNSVQMPIVMLGSDLTIRRFTPLAAKAFNLIPTDVGRRITDIKPEVEVPNLEKLVEGVLDSLNTVHREVQDNKGDWHSLLIRPYRTVDNKIDGVITMLADITIQKKHQSALQKEKDRAVHMETREREARQLAEATIDTVRAALLVLDGDLRVMKANRFFYKIFKVAKSRTEGKYFYELGNGQWDIPQLRRLLEEIIPQNNRFEDFRVEHDFPKIGRKEMLLNARKVEMTESKQQVLLLAIEDVTGKEAK
ncbi:PAS domain-containing protein, partial [bacterium]|nr:PAS domain-containing protein [bacterium]